MAKLLKIIMINGHLPGVVELELDGHTNICGSNASGKTTLQRMIPVFYGELPNRVVPRTRLSFDKYYLPYKNSYVIYEYERPRHGLAQVVLTKRADGIDYRFVDAGYDPQHYLLEKTDGVVAKEYQDWAHFMRGLSIDMSAKISTTTEYRNIILNDIKNDRSQRSESLKHRQLAARYALAQDNHRLRHIEKLVSAVHAKEGKMDTLKSMLAAILEEDGYQRPANTFTGDKIKSWLRDMKQFMKVERLQKSLAEIERVSAERNNNVAALWQLKKVIESDFSQQKIAKADAEQRLQLLKRELAEAQAHYEQVRGQLRQQQGDAQADLDQAEQRLSSAQREYDDYREQDVERLGRELELLPERRAELQELEQHYHLLMEKHQDAEQQLNSHKLKLRDALEHKSQKLRAQMQVKAGLREQLMQAQLDAAKQQSLQLQQELQRVREQFEAQLEALQSELAAKQAQAGLSMLNSDEHEAMRIAEARVDEAQERLNQQQTLVTKQQEQLNVALRERERADADVRDARSRSAQAASRVEQLQQQLAPAPGSLRQFLGQHVDDWQQSLGKVLAEPLLQRTDLAPQQVNHQEQTSLYGIQLDLSAVELPDYASTDERLQEQLEQASEQWQRTQQQVQEAEKAFAKAVEHAKLQQQQLDRLQQQLRSSTQDVEFARDNKQRLLHTQRQLEQERKGQLRQRLEQLQQQLQKTKEQRAQALAEVESEQQTLALEQTAEFQEQLQILDDAVADLSSELERAKAQTAEQMADLERSFSAKLADEGVDPKRLAELKQERLQRSEHIRDTEAQRDHFAKYQQFMQVTWQGLRPQWLAAEQRAKQQLREVSAELELHENKYRDQKQLLQRQANEVKEQLEKIERQVMNLQALVQRMADLPVATIAALDTDFNAGDVSEHVARAHQLLDDKQKLDKDLEQRVPRLESDLRQDADSQFMSFIEQSLGQLGEAPDLQAQVTTLAELLKVLEAKQEQTIDQGRTIGKGLFEFFTVFNDIHKRVSDYSRRLTQAVTDELTLDGIDKAEVKISSTIDELSFWKPLKEMTYQYKVWNSSGELLPPAEYIEHLTEVADLLKANQEYTIESLLKLQLNLIENGEPVVIRNDRQLTDSSSHGMAYLILCKFLLAFTRLLRPPQADVTIHWPIDEIGTLAYHNVEKLFDACNHNNIDIVGAFPNPESDVLLLFKHRYLIEPHAQQPNKGQLKRIKPRVSELTKKLQQLQPAHQVTGGTA
ncbi:ATP-binding protein [Pseudidiomarina sp. PP-1MA]|uniref:ATP-binding protein n=1 Tax=Pseudidiomarina sp. PP-1MA TaxID=3237706 RepID=A0AB39X961_9GAMM